MIEIITVPQTEVLLIDSTSDAVTTPGPATHTIITQGIQGPPGGGPGGTVSSVAVSVPAGFAVAGSPVTTSGNIAITFDAGYSLPTDALQADWSDAFAWGDHALAGYLDAADIGVSVQAYSVNLDLWSAIDPADKVDVVSGVATDLLLTTPTLHNTASGTGLGELGWEGDGPVFGDGTTQQAFGFRNIPRRSQSLNYTCLLTDAGKFILHPSADTTARVFTIPANSSVPYINGTALTFVNQDGGGTITIAITSDTMRLAGPGTTGSRTLAANGIATALKVSATEWLISGVNLT